MMAVAQRIWTSWAEVESAAGGMAGQGGAAAETGQGGQGGEAGTAGIAGQGGFAGRGGDAGGAAGQGGLAGAGGDAGSQAGTPGEGFSHFVDPNCIDGQWQEPLPIPEASLDTAIAQFSGGDVTPFISRCTQCALSLRRPSDSGGTRAWCL